VVLNLFERTFAVGAHFGVVLVATEVAADGSLDAGAEEARPHYFQTEVATFRADGAYSDGRHPDAVRYTLSAEEDVRRRDFTINGLLLDPERLPLDLGEAELFSNRNELRHAVLDYVGGVADLDAGVVRAIGNPADRFAEDHLRMLRAVRFAARFEFTIEPLTLRAIQLHAGKIAAVSRERVRDELTKMLTEGHARRAFELLDESDLLVQVLPEIARMKGVEQPPQYHPEGDVWVHTLALLGQLEAGCSPALAWGALLHDVGKPATFRRAPDRIRFDRHVEVGVAIAAEICRRFRFSNEETKQILALVENHMRFADATKMKASTLKRFFRLDNFAEHLALHRMDCVAASGNLDHYEFVRERWLDMPEETVRPQPLITGRDLIAAGYVPGPAFHEILRAVEDEHLEGSIATREEAMNMVRERFPNRTDGAFDRQNRRADYNRAEPA
jgi:poly(A) polymerase